MKNSLWTFLIFVILSLLFSCNKGSFIESEKGIIIFLPASGKLAPGLVKINVVAEDIFRVSARPGNTLPERTGLSVLPQTIDQVPFTVNKWDDRLEISTASISATVSLLDGQIIFSDNQGKLLLQELAGGGKTFTPIEVDNRTGYSFRQVFESPDEEAFFGLGQHQSDEWNYKGKNKVCFPEGDGWYDIESGIYIPGGTRKTVAVPHDIIPIHVRAGSILPFGPDIPYVGEKPGAPITYSETSKSLIIGPRAGSFEGMLNEREFRIIYVDKEPPKAINFKAKPDPIISYTGTEKA